MHSMPWCPSQQRQVLNLIVDFLAKDCGLASQRQAKSGT